MGAAIVTGTNVDGTWRPNVDGTWRPYVEAAFRYAGDDLEDCEHVAIALLDTGASRSFLPAELLPDDVDCSRLTRSRARIRNGLSQPGSGFELRLWRADVSILGVRIARGVIVAWPGRGTEPASPVDGPLAATQEPEPTVAARTAGAVAASFAA